MSFTVSVANIIPGTMALSLAGKSIQNIPQNDFWGNGKKKTKDKNMIKGFVPIMAGIPMIGIVSGQVSALS